MYVQRCAKLIRRFPTTTGLPEVYLQTNILSNSSTKIRKNIDDTMKATLNTDDLSIFIGQVSENEKRI